MRIYKIEYVEMTPDEAEEAEGLDILEVIAEIDGDVGDAVNFWAAEAGLSIVNYKQLSSSQKVPEMYISSTGFYDL